MIIIIIKQNKKKRRSFKSSEHINEKGDGPCRSSSSVTLLIWQHGAKENQLFCFANLDRVVDTKTSIIQMD